MSPQLSPETQLLRHTLATLVYRAAKVLRGAPAEFETYRPFPDTRSAVQILAHIGDLLDWGLELCDGRHVWRDAVPLAWVKETDRFFAAAMALDARLGSATELGFPAVKLFQGPIADALTHVGQLAMMRRMAGAPVKGENYFRADIQAGRVGPDQTGSAVEFD